MEINLSCERNTEQPLHGDIMFAGIFTNSHVTSKIGLAIFNCSLKLKRTVGEIKLNKKCHHWASKRLKIPSQSFSE